jgi:hypothetical protein
MDKGIGAGTLAAQRYGTAEKPLYYIEIYGAKTKPDATRGGVYASLTGFYAPPTKFYA